MRRSRGDVDHVAGGDVLARAAGNSGAADFACSRGFGVIHLAAGDDSGVPVEDVKEIGVVLVELAAAAAVAERQHGEVARVLVQDFAGRAVALCRDLLQMPCPLQELGWGPVIEFHGLRKDSNGAERGGDEQQGCRDESRELHCVPQVVAMRLFEGAKVRIILYGSGQRTRTLEYLKEHGTGELAGVRVLQGWMIAGDNVKAVGQGVLEAVSKGVAGTGGEMAGAPGPCQEAVESDAAKADDDAEVGQQVHLLIEPGSAVA